MKPTQHSTVSRRSTLPAITAVAALVLLGASARTISAQSAATQSMGDSGAVLAGRADPGIRIEASISQRRLLIKRGDEVLREYPIAVGQEGYPTPHGKFMIRRIVWNPRWTP